MLQSKVKKINKMKLEEFKRQNLYRNDVVEYITKEPNDSGPLAYFIKLNEDNQSIRLAHRIKRGDFTDVIELTIEDITYINKIGTSAMRI